jgi:hypothetical protein
MPRYQCKPNCCFVESWHKESGTKRPDDYPFPHVFNQGTGDYVEFDKAGAFIARFIIQGLDTDFIPQILVSEYGSGVKNPQGEVAQVLADMLPFLDILPGPPRSYKAPAKGKSNKGHKGTFELNFKPNLIGNIIIKG